MPETENAPATGGEARRHLGEGGPAFERRLAALDAWDSPWVRPDAKYLTVLLINEAVSGVITTAVLCVPLVLRLLGIWSWPWLWLAIALPALSLAWTILELVLSPRRARARGYSEREDDLLVRRGVMWHRITVVPYGRMQYVEVSSGPWDRLFGLAKVELHTASASTDVKIEGISQHDAARLREDLAQRGEDRLAAL
ncbi:PH domain-containing protein [Rothia sp. AR01]|uniref:PH domain-containing protein n=1 Tax=Rothia santali TaxID=2949643 RepID=A0A9X2KJA1_9MICC|nr:PH domain-containing protein [Rothia santali]MCP3426639.1 PH domain-containing protein [Rothia santali]